MLDPRKLPLQRLLAFAAVAEEGSFTAAARHLDQNKTLLSQQVAKLETELGGALFVRTTRRVTLTEAGAQLHAACKPLLEGLAAAVERFGSEQAQIAGRIRVTSMHDFSASVLGALLARFAQGHPGIGIELILADGVVDLVKEGVDLAIRFGWPRDSSLRASKLGEFEQWVLAAPAYLARAGIPSAPEDLAHHDWVALSLLSKPLDWAFCHADGRERRVHVHAAHTSNSPDGIRALINAGAGLSVLATSSATAELADGRLVRVLSDWQLPRGGIHALYPGSREQPARVRALIDFLREELAQR